MSATHAHSGHGHGHSHGHGGLAGNRGVLLLAASGWIIVEGVRRLDEPHAIEGGGVALVAAVALVVNVGSSVLLGRARGESLNIKGAYTHMVYDAIASAGVLVSGLAIL